MRRAHNQTERRSVVNKKWSFSLFGLLLGCSGDGGTGPEDVGALDVQLALAVVASGLNQPLFVTQLPGDERLFVVEQPGGIQIIESGQIRATPFLDLSNSVRTGFEQGLLGMAFHPDYQANGFFYVFHTDVNEASAIVRYSVSADPHVADAASAVVILTIAQPFANHNGGQLAFGPDGLLYIGLGDGGSGGDPQGHGQNRATLLGSILRIDVDNPDAGMNYGIPDGNPFAGDPTGRDEIWIYGVRNPWRFSFDSPDNLLYVADVGQNAFEEISVVTASTGGLNFGWNVMEASSCFQTATCDMSGLVQPALEYANGGSACSVTGGYVYRGSAIPEIRGHYFYSDWCGGFLRSFRYEGGGATAETDWGLEAGNVTSFGQGSDGELYLTSSDGEVLRVVVQP